jgi:hypothetical protein
LRREAEHKGDKKMFERVIVNEKGEVMKKYSELSLRDIVEIINEHPGWSIGYVEVQDD